MIFGASNSIERQKVFLFAKRKINSPIIRMGKAEIWVKGNAKDEKEN